MKAEKQIPNIVDFAYQVISMDKEIQHLRREVEHYKSLHEINSKTINNSIDNNAKCIGIVLEAALDPDSTLNKRHELI